MMVRAARSLDTLLQQLNAKFPRRNKASDGGVGDAAHASRTSDHNADRNGVYHARDYTHDPANGVDIGRFSDELAASRDRRIKYIIANKLFWEPSNPRWVAYTGSNPHTHHLHLSVWPGSGDDGAPWNLPMLGGAATAPTAPPAKPTTNATLQKGSTGDAVKTLQKVLAKWYPDMKLAVDGIFGPATDAAVRRLQQNSGLVVDGIVGPKTLSKLGL